jgi:hypothetical protein
MAKIKILKPGQVVFDKQQNEYVNLKAESADHPGKAYVFNPRCGETYLTEIRALTRKELGLP